MTTWKAEDPPTDWARHVGPDGAHWDEELRSAGFRAVVAFRRPQVQLPPPFQVGAPTDRTAPDPARVREMLAAQTMVDDDDDDVPPATPPGPPVPDRATMQRMLADETIDDHDDDDEAGDRSPDEVWLAREGGGTLMAVCLDRGRTRVAAVSLFDSDGAVVTEVGQPGMAPSLPIRSSPRTHRTVHPADSLGSLLASHTAFARKVAGGEPSPSSDRAAAVEAKQRLTGAVV